MALFNTPAYNQRVASMSPAQTVAPLADNRPEVPWYMTQRQADDRVIGGPVERKGFAGRIDGFRASIEKKNAGDAFRKKYAELIEKQKRTRANNWLDKWFEMNPQGSTSDAAEYYRNSLDSYENLELSRKRSLGQMSKRISGMPSGTLKDAYSEQLRKFTEMTRGRNSRDYMDYKPTAPMGRRPWEESGYDSYTV